MFENTYWKGRGKPSDFDPGPAKNLKWARLFSETPNYRGLSKEDTGREKFRWHFGPMYYRGRLGKNKVKVLIIGQEGAQDESLSHRSFTGGTGARMQHFLHTLGINYSYLFVNTFVYPIFGQYDDKIKWLAQNNESPIVQHRHDIFDYILEKNDVRLIIAVGTAAKETVQTWVEYRGGTCSKGAQDVSFCTGNFLDAKTQIVGVMHPGGAGKGGSVTKIKASFIKVLDQVKAWTEADPEWLPVDKGMERDFSLPYKYSSKPIPFHDFPFGCNWRLGRGGTSSNRKDSQRSIQIFSKEGKYSNKGHSIKYDSINNGDDEGYYTGKGDVPYEPDVHRYKDYDKGPSKSWATLLSGCKPGFEYPDLKSLGVKAHDSFGNGPIYRGTLTNPRFIIFADQKCHDDLFNMRAMTGDAGQHIQSFLNAAGIKKSYCIIRVFPFDTIGLSEPKCKEIAEHPQILKLYDEIIDRLLRKNKTKVILTFGHVSQYLMDRLSYNPPSEFNLKNWGESGAQANWNEALDSIKDLAYKRDIKNPSYHFDGTRTMIPSFDLPYGTLKWQGSGGDRGRRAKNKNGTSNMNYYKFSMPKWAWYLKPEPLSDEEQEAIDNHV